MQIKELGHVVLYVTNIDRAVQFYRDVLGFPVIGLEPGIAVFSSGRSHHEMLLIEVGGVPHKAREPQPGLYHIGFKVGDSDDELRAVAKELAANHVPVIGATDHGVTHSIYITDPDGNELELYVDVSDEWKTNPRAILKPAQALQL
jgi:catechol-2,3-dioxygenase